MLLLIPLAIFSQKLDPLLQRPWINDISDEEEKFYNRLSNIITKRKHFFLNNDIFGREYKIKWDGSIQFILNDLYRDSFPDYRQLDVHLSESEVLAENGNYVQSVRLLKGINLCNRLMIKNNISEKLKNYEASTKMLNSLLARFSHKEEKIAILTDPYGCFIPEKENTSEVLFVESEPYSFRFQIGKDFRYNFPESEDEISGKEADFSWKFLRLVKRNPQPADKKGSFEEELKKSAKDLLNPREERLIFFVGMTFHFSNLIYTKDNYYLLWDLRRGLTKNRIREIEFKRERIGNYYESTFKNVTESGEKKNIAVKEKYFLRKNKGLFFSLSFPVEKKSEADDEWNLFMKTLDVK